MITHSHIPSQPLSESIALFWHFEGQDIVHEKERLMPDGTSELVINLHEDRLHTYDRVDLSQAQSYRGSLVCGPQSRDMVIDTEAQGAIMGIHFKPGGAYTFFGMPLDELHNQHVSLEDLWGHVAAELHEQLVDAPDPASRFRLLEQYLRQMQRQLRRTPHHPAVQYALGALKAPMAPSMAALEERLGLSARRFIALFKREVGMTPKRYARLCRFQRALQQLSAPQQKSIDLVEIALSCGYCDQSHLNRDFKAFAGVTPSLYVEGYQAHHNHVAIVGEE